MVDPGEDSFDAAKREFLEEVFSLEDMNAEEGETLKKATDDVLKSNKVVYRGYVDDRRSTDNSWIETFAVLYLIEDKDNPFNHLKFKAGSDAKGAEWVDIKSTLSLYASHGDLIKKVVDILHAYYGE
jgi:8-oxo-dGTP pyrophosphatase MutT (NUDIX family)